MTQFRIDRLRFTWKGTWSSNTIYTKDDIVRYSGKSYVCLVGHTSTVQTQAIVNGNSVITGFNTDLNQVNTNVVPNVPNPYWTLWLDGYSWQGEWQNGSLYNAGDLVSYSGTVYICNTAHVSIPANTQLLITSTTPSSPVTGQVTVNFTSQNIVPFLTGSTVTLAGFTNSAFNGSFTVVLCTKNNVVITSAATGATTGSPTISGNIQAGLEYNQSYWSVYSSSDNWIGAWSVGYRYRVNDLVKYGGIVYRCSAGHVSSALLENDLANWTAVVITDKWNTDWTTSTHYKSNDVVRYGGIVYRCVAAHDSASTNNDPFAATPGGLEANQASWSIVISGVDYKGIWLAATRYKVADVVKYGANVYRCQTGHVSAVTFDISKWNLYIPGEQYRNSWNASLNYVLGDVVKYGGNSYVAVANNLNADPSTDSAKWNLLTTGYLTLGDWSSTTLYQPGDVIRRNGYLYVAATDTQAEDPNSNIGGWLLIVSGNQWQNRWTQAQSYALGDIVTYYATSYSCVLQHVSSGGNNPIADVNGTYWKVFVQGDHFEVLTNLGDMTTYTTYTKQTVVPIGTAGMVMKSTGSLPYWGSFGQITDVYYVANTTGVDAPNYGLTLNAPFATIAYACNYVLNGAYYQNTAKLLNSNKQWIIAEMYNWMLYQKSNSISPFSPSSSFDPQKTQRDAEYIIDAIVYDITRGGNSQTVASALSYFQPGTNNFYNATVTTQMPFFIAALGQLLSLMQTATSNSLAGTSYQALNSSGNASLAVTGASGTGSIVTLTFANQTNLLFSLGQTIVVSAITPQRYNGTFTITALSSTSVSFASTTTDTYIAGGLITGSSVSQTILSGTASESGTSVVISSLMNIITTVLSTQNTSTVPPSNTGVTSTIFIKDGTYNEILPIIVPENCAIVGDELRNTIVQPSATTASLVGSITGTSLVVTSVTSGIIVIGMWVSGSTIYAPTQITGFVSGSNGGAGTYTVSTSQTVGNILMTAGYATGNMFYCRNGSGIRNMTLSGLTGALGPLNTYLTARPTAGAYVSLDPGLGPNDTSAWIFRKSPYVQNVTTFGSGCAGLKIDGSLHAGGNKSIVANDFTQVLSDGIGVWCTGPGALTECVSVFAYYNHAAYLAEAGGKIRATNGNSSYGTYGAVAEGFDITEVPFAPTVYNRYYSASVASAFAGQSQNKILLLEYSNCGQNYTNATFAFSGAGTQAAVLANEFRDNGIFEAHLVGATFGLGGSGYLTSGNQSQGGTSTTITIAQNDQYVLANYQGMRVIIVSGTGVGQYGFIGGYNTTSKVISVFSEASGNAGWDHVYPGTPIATTLDSTTQYSIEPRPTFSAPAFTPTPTTLPATGLWISTAYGNNSFVAIDSSGLSAYSANGIVWNAGATLSVGIYTGLAYGNGYFVAVSGGLAGASTVSAYSTNAGATWTPMAFPVAAAWTGIAYGNGTFVAVGTSTYQGTGNTTAVNTTGNTWIAGGNLPSNQQWRSVAFGAVNNTFVAVSSGPSNAAAYSTNGGASWTATTLPSSANWVSVTFGNSRFVAIATGGATAAYSLDGITWYQANNLPSIQAWATVAYGQGLFVAVVTGSGVAASSQDGINWTSRSIATTANWTSLTFGNPTINGTVTPSWVIVSNNGSNTGISLVAGAQAMGRPVVVGGSITLIKIWEPGSSYTGTPTITFSDPNVLINSGVSATIVCRTATGVLAQPTWINRGQNYQTTTTQVSISGNGFADSFQGTDGYVVVQGITVAPTPGANLVISGINYQYSVTSITQLSGTIYKLQLSIVLDNAQTPNHGTSITIRVKYSQVRLTGHDFLYVGTGNFNTTNYPNVNIGTALQNQQIQFNGGGRVFVVSTDQDGNFKVGNLFGVQQATGIVTISASLFNLSGVTALSLGGVSIGQNAVIITQFSTDSYFTANSDAIIPTQKAIKSYISRAISTGGSNAVTGTVLAGLVGIGDRLSYQNQIFTTSGGAVYMGRSPKTTPSKTTFAGQYQGVPSGIDGNMLAMSFFVNSGSQL